MAEKTRLLPNVSAAFVDTLVICIWKAVGGKTLLLTNLAPNIVPWNMQLQLYFISEDEVLACITV